MKAALIHNYSGIDHIEIEDVEIPLPSDNEVQITIHCAGVNPVDWKLAEGLIKAQIDYQFPVVLGWDLAGEITQVGKQVKNWKIGDRVVGFTRSDPLHIGTYAEVICTTPAHLAKLPPELTYPQAAALPIPSLTAWQALYDLAELRKEEVILIHAGAGGVGGFAIQFAKRRGAHVITTCRACNFDYVTLLGADETIDYSATYFDEELLKRYPAGVDVVLDSVGSETLDQSYPIVKEGGHLITIAGVIDVSIAQKRQLKTPYMSVQPNGKQLQEIVNLVAKGEIALPRIQEFAFEDFDEALRLVRQGHMQGKCVLAIQDGNG